MDFGEEPDSPETMDFGEELDTEETLDTGELAEPEPDVAVDADAKEEILLEEGIITAESDETPESSPDISAVLELLARLKQLTDELPENEKDSYLQGRFPAALEAVIDSFKNLTIIGDSHGSES